MDISNLTFTQTTFRRGYSQQQVDEFLDLIAANLALPLAERTLRAEQVMEMNFTSTMFRGGYDEEEVDTVMDQLSVELGLPSPSEHQNAPNPTTPPPLPQAPTSTPGAAPPVTPGSPTTSTDPTDDFRPDSTF
jgi:DivIVA domain-containing protein